MLPAQWMPKSHPTIPSFRDDEVKNGSQAVHFVSRPKKGHICYKSIAAKELKQYCTPKKTGGVTVYGYRHYTPKTGQFLGRDPIGERGGMNLYGFIYNNPTGWIDILGNGPLMPLVAGGFATDVAIPEPSDVAWPKWAGWGAAFLIAAAGDAIIEAVNEAGNSLAESMSSNHPPGYWPADKGAEEWGRRNGIGKDRGRKKFHDIKGDDPCSRATDDYGVDPASGDVIDPDGEPVGNLGD